MIREFNPQGDRPELRRLLVELQEYERIIDPRMPDGESIADDYIDDMLSELDIGQGTIFIAESGDRLGGYATVFIGVVSNEVDDSKDPHALISDIMVDPRDRARGLGRELMETAIDYACKQGMPTIRLSVLAKNHRAHDFYQSLGFSDLCIDMEKTLS